jgi:hypothetical protein
VDERRVVAVRDEHTGPRGAFDHRRRRENGAWKCRRLEGLGCDGNEDRQIDCVIAIGGLD